MPNERMTMSLAQAFADLNEEQQNNIVLLFLHNELSTITRRSMEHSHSEEELLNMLTEVRGCALAEGLVGDARARFDKAVRACVDIMVSEMKL